MEKKYKSFSKDRNNNQGRRKDFSKQPETEEVNECLVSGRNAVRELLMGERDIDKIFVQRGEREGSIVQILGIAAERKIPIIEVDKTRLDSMTAGGRHQGVVALAAEHNYSDIDDIFEYAESLGEKPFIIMLDGVEDPHNLGAIIRSAECCGAHGIIIPKRRAVGLTPTVSKAAAGATEYMRVARVTNLAQTVDELKERGMWIYAADMGGEEYYKTDLTGNVCVVMGSEGFGISRLVREKCDFTLSIKLHGRVNSMNVSCAAAIILAEVARQREGGANG